MNQPFTMLDTQNLHRQLIYRWNVLLLVTEIIIEDSVEPFRQCHSRQGCWLKPFDILWERQLVEPRYNMLLKLKHLLMGLCYKHLCPIARRQTLAIIFTKVNTSKIFQTWWEDFLFGSHWLLLWTVLLHSFLLFLLFGTINKDCRMIRKFLRLLKIWKTLWWIG
jgi:hypothetical protein